MTMSNVGKQWICLDRDEDRTKRARPAQKEDIAAGRDVFEMEGMDGKWMESWDMRSKYTRRDKQLYNISFAHFARMMESAPKTSKEKEPADDQKSEEGQGGKGEKKKKEETAWYAAFHKVMECSHMCCTGVQKADCSASCCSSDSQGRQGRHDTAASRTPGY